MSKNTNLDRRDFLGAAAGAATIGVATFLPRHVLGGPKFVPPSEKIHVAYVGCGTQGLRQMMPALAKQDLRIVAVCDPNRKSDDYPEWGRNELNDKIRKFLGDASWAQGARGGLCGREVGLEVVRRHYGKQNGSGKDGECRAYADFREMLHEEKDLDAVYNMTPEHLHAVVAVRAMRQGKHVITHKPISNVLEEVRIARNAAARRAWPRSCSVRPITSRPR